MKHGWTLLHGGALGDLVLALQVALRLPHADEGVHVLSRTDPGDLSACQPQITRRSSEGLGMHWLYGEDAAQPNAGRSATGVEPVDRPPGGAGVDPTSALPSLRDVIAGRRVLSFLSGPDAGVHRRLAALAPAALYGVDPQPWPASAQHITRQWQQRLQTQGAAIPPAKESRHPSPVLRVPQSLRDRGHALLASRVGPSLDAGDVIVIHPGSGGRAKCWPRPAFIAVGEFLRDMFGVVFVLGPVELETWPAAAIAAVEECAATIRAPSPDELVVLLAGAAAVIGNDAGAAHLAALLGVPTVAVFGPTDPRVWRPLGLYVEAVRGEPPRGDDWGLSMMDVAKPAVALIQRRNRDISEGRRP